MAKTIVNEQFSLQKRDFSKGAIVTAVVAALYAVFEAILAIVSEGGITAIADKESLLRIAGVAVTTMLGYLLKNWGEKSKVVTIHEGD